MSINKFDLLNEDFEPLIENEVVYFYDPSGTVFSYSLNKKKINWKFNFYKKRFKNKAKKLSIKISSNSLIVADNFGYLYAYDYIKNEVIWAKNYKVPFRSNLKIIKNKLIAGNQNNDLYFFDKRNGAILSFIPTEDTVLKNQFKNNISVNNLNTFYYIVLL